MFKDLSLWKKSIFARLLITFLIVMIPIYFVGISIYYWGLGVVKSEISDTKLSQLAFYMGNLENDIQRVKLLQSDFIFSDDLNRLAISEQYMTEYERSTFILRLQQRLNAIKSSSTYIQDVRTIIPSINRVITAWSGVGELRQIDLDIMKMHDNSTSSQIAYVENEPYLNAAFPFNYSESTDPLYSIEIKLSIPELLKALNQFNSYEDSVTLLFSNNNNFRISTDGWQDVSADVQKHVESHPHLMSDGQQFLNINKKNYLVVYTTSHYMGITICNYIPEKQIFKTTNKYKIWFWLLSLVVAIIIAVFTFFTYRFIQQPIKKMIHAFNRLENGDMSFTINHKSNDEFQYMFEHFNKMLKNLNLLIEQSYKQKIMIQSIELKQLQAQINPHFLYNSFFILYTMIRRGDQEVLEKFALQLGEYFQFITRSASDEVPLSKEVNHAKTYCDIQGMRFSNRIRIVFDDLSQQYEDLKVPRLIIQPLVENAFEHGLEKKAENGLLHIYYDYIEYGICINVEENGEEITDDKIQMLQEKINYAGDDIEVTGMINIHRRIKIKFGNNSGVYVSRGTLGGLKVSVNIILGEQGELHV